MNEAQTRRQIIDLELGKRGWGVNNPSEVIIEFQMEMRLDHRASEPQQEYA